MLAKYIIIIIINKQKKPIYKTATTVGFMFVPRPTERQGSPLAVPTARQCQHVQHLLLT